MRFTYIWSTLFCLLIAQDCNETQRIQQDKPTPNFIQKINGDLVKECKSEVLNCEDLEEIQTCCPYNNQIEAGCYGLLDKAKYKDSKCPYNYVLPSGVLYSKEPVWVDVQRNLDYGIGQFISTNYMTSTNILSNLTYKDKIVGSNCVVYDEGIYKATPCELSYKRVCFYDSLYANDFHYCFSIANETCQPKNFNTSELTCLCIEQFSEFSTTEVSACNPREIQFNYTFPTIKLLFKPPMTLIITVTSVTSLVNYQNHALTCFTDGAKANLFQFWLYVEPSLNGVSITLGTSGGYWCQGIEIKNFEPIVSEKVFFINNNIYPVEITFRYSQGEDPTDQNVAWEKYIQQIDYSYNSTYPSNNIVVKWMKTLMVDEEKLLVKYLVHINTPKKSERIFNDYNLLKKHLTKLNVEAISELYSGDYCMTDVSKINYTLTWNTTEANNNTTSYECCLDKFGQKIPRNCTYNFYEGARWDKIQSCFVYSNEETKITKILIELLDSNLPTYELVSNLTLLTENITDFISIDIFLTAKLLQKFKANEVDLKNLTNIFSNLMEANETTLNYSQSNNNATDDILASFDRILDVQKWNNSNKSVQNQNVITFMFDIRTTNYTGLALMQNGRILKIERNMSLDSTANLPDLEIATYIPNNLLQQLEEHNEVKAVIYIFMKHTLFQTTESIKVRAKNIAVLLPKKFAGYNLPIIFKPIESTSNLSCGYWCYGRNLYGHWQPESESSKLSNKLQLCQFPHVTHFALLLVPEENFIRNTKILEVVTAIGCILSCFGFMGIFLTAALFKSWRSNKGNIILLNYSLVSSLQIFLLYISVFIPNIITCIVIGFILHFTVLSQFSWMLIFAYLQYIRYVLVLQCPSTRILAKSYLICYLLPAIIVGISFSIYSGNYTTKHVGFCYLTGYSLIFGLLLPIAIIVTINITLFIMITIELCLKSKTRFKSDSMIYYKLRALILMFFMLGITWIFGLISVVSKDDTILIFFCGTASLQGFVLFLFFILFNKYCRLMYVFLLKKYNLNL